MGIATTRSELLGAIVLVVASACRADPQTDVACPQPDRAVEATFYVAPHGDDAAAGTDDAPFATLARAQVAVRALAPAMTGDVIVRVAAGDYVLASTLALDRRDSGTNGYKVIYTADTGTVRLLGGRPITSWTHGDGPILTAHVDGELHTLYEDGVRADEARFPDRDGLSSARAGYLVTTGGTDQALDADGLPAFTGDTSALAVVIWSNAGHAWFTDIVPVAAIDRGHIELARPTRYAIGAGARLFLEGARELLTAPGEWYLDAATGTLYYWPRSPNAHEIIAPALTTLVSIVGASPAEPVHDVQLRGLGFVASDFTAWYRFGWPHAGDSGEGHLVPEFDRQLEMPGNRLGMITLENTDHVDIVDARVADAGYGGIYLRFANQHDCISGTLVEHVGINGITVQGGYPGEGDVSHDNTISNVLVRGVGELAGNAAGIDISNSSANEVAFATIRNSPRYGVIVHAAAHVSGDLLYAHDNLVHDVAIANTCQDSGDTGALYVFGVGARTNELRDIAIDGATADPSMHDLAPNGVFADNDSAEQAFWNIAVTDTAGDPYRGGDQPQSFMNVSWQAGFDAARLDPAIGVGADFPYR